MPDAHRVMADPLLESGKAGLIWKAQRGEREEKGRERGSHNVIFKGEFDFILQVFGKEREREAPGIRLSFV